MSFAMSEHCHVAALPVTVTVALCDGAAASAAALHAAVAARPHARAVAWHMLAVEAIASGARVDIAVCDSPEASSDAHARWPDATVLALVSAHDDGSATLAALNAGAHVCVRGNEVTLVAAYLHSVARRRGLLADEGAR